MSNASFDISRYEMYLVDKIVERAMKMGLYDGTDYDNKRQTLSMDVTACHANGCQLKLAELLEADDFTFSHDIVGILTHINRETGEIERNFLPRLSLGENE